MNKTFFPDIVLGTAGHIDHGKSSLVLALTGTDPDRLSEEKKRGITIELGFAQLKMPNGNSVGVVDVPGHERFVRQMIAGATGIDLALLCIAADDGIMPQTKEHLSVLELLGVSSLVVALTKIDLIDEEWIAFMSEEIATYLDGTVFAGSPIIGVSSRTGAGLSHLKDTLQKAARNTTRQATNDTLRLPIDRVFTIKGSGTVVTGTLWNGQACVGDEVEIQPHKLRTRIRSIQIHDKPVECATAGHRVALNLNAVSISDIKPGDFLFSPNSTITSDRFDAQFTYLGTPGRNKPLTSGTRVRIAHGTREVAGRVLFINEQETLRTKEQAFVQIRLEEPLPISWKDRFIVRSYSPTHVIGGGTVLRAKPRRTTILTEASVALLEALCSGDEKTIARCALELYALPFSAESFAKTSGLSIKSTQQQLEALALSGIIVVLKARGEALFYIPKRSLQKQRSTIEKGLLQFHSKNPAATGISKENLRQRLYPNMETSCFDCLLEDAAAHKIAMFSDGEVFHPSASMGARKLEEQISEKLYAILEQSKCAPPAISELASKIQQDMTLTSRSLNALEKSERIVRVSQEFYFETSALNALEQAVRARLTQGSATAAELKEAMNTSRKYAIPLLEYFDNKAVTRRIGDSRELIQANCK